MPTCGRDRSLCPGRSTSPATSTSTSRTRTTSGSTMQPGYVYSRSARAVRDRGSAPQHLLHAPSRAEPRGDPRRLDRRARPGPTDRPRNLARDPVTLGPAQMSRLVFATPRVRNLLGLRNLEIRDLDKSSLDTVMLGRATPVVLSGRHRSDPKPLRGFARTRCRAPARRDRVPQRSGRPRAGHRQRSPTGAEQAAANRRPAPPPGQRRQGQAGRTRLPVENARKEVVTITSSAGTHHQAPPVRDRPGRRSGGCRPLPARHECASR